MVRRIRNDARYDAALVGNTQAALVTQSFNVDFDIHRDAHLLPRHDSSKKKAGECSGLIFQ
jgi:hypothetical protein